MLLHDNVEVLKGARRTADGYMVVSGRGARANNIQVYSGDELGFSGRSTVRVWRPESEVLSEKSLASWAWKPICIDHPPQPVSASNYRQHVVGHVGSDVLRDGEFVRIGLLIADAEAQSAVLAGRRELSAGYSVRLDQTPGRTPDGREYDAVARDVRINHVACVVAGRAGATRIGDAQPRYGNEGLRTMSDHVIDQALMADAADRLALTVQGLSPADQVAVIQDALTVAAARAAERRGRSPDSARGAYVEHLRNAWQTRLA